MSLSYGTVSLTGRDVLAQNSIVATLDHGIAHIDAYDVRVIPEHVLDHVEAHFDAYDVKGVVAELAITLLKPEFCRFEENFKTLKARIKLKNQFDPNRENLFTAKIITGITDPSNPESKLEFPLTTWTQKIGDNTTKLIKEYDLNLVTFELENCDIDLPLNIGKHTLEVRINDQVETAEFDVVPVTVQSVKNQYMLGVDMVGNSELVLQQDLRKITGVEVLHISKETAVGSKEFTWNAKDQTLQWDFGAPVVISDDHMEYEIFDHMMEPSLAGGDYIKVNIEDIDNLPSINKTEVVLVDVKKYKNEEYQYWINTGLRVLTELMIMTDIEPTLYSSDKSLGYKYLDPVTNQPKSQSESSNITFEFATNMLQCVQRLWVHQRGISDVDLNVNKHVELSTDGAVTVIGHPYGRGSGNTAIWSAGIWDRTLYAKNGHRDYNKVKNFWNATVVAGIPDSASELRLLSLDIISKLAAVDLYVQSGLGRGSGIASRSFSVGGISSSFNSVESAENALMSSSILEIQRKLGVGRATKDEQKTGLVQSLKTKILGGALSFKF